MCLIPASSLPIQPTAKALAAMAFLLAVPGLRAGPYPPAAGKAGSTAIARDDARIKGWAAGVAAFTRGPMNAGDPGLGPARYGTPESALGPADVGEPEQQPEPGAPGPFQVVSLGDGGSITLAFSPPIADGAGFDFAVFENGFRDSFLELALVEASSDGLTFFRFPAVSLTQTTTQISNGGSLDPTNLHNLAGKYRARYGTPFDLADLASPAPPAGLDLQRITHLRIIDVVGALDPALATRDSLGNIINDPWPTTFESSGFDLDAVAVLNQASPLMTYAQWRQQWDWAGRPSDPAADADADGVANVLEYAFNTPPLLASAEPAITLSHTDGAWTARFPLPRPDATGFRAGVETSPDLKNWTFREGLEPLPLTSGLFCRIVIHLDAPEP